MVIKTRNIKPVCEILSSFTGPFSFHNSEGEIIFASPGSGKTDSDIRFDITVEGTPVGYLAGTNPEIGHAASLLGLFIKSDNEKRILTEHTLQRYRELIFITEMNKLLGSSLDLNEILSAMTRKVHEIINVASCSVIVPDHKLGKFVLKAVSGRIVNEPLELTINEGIAGKVLETGSGVIMNNPQEDPSFVKKKTDIISLLCLPLKLKGATLGILNLNNKTDGMFTSEDEALMNSLCVMVAEVIENASLLEEKIKSEKFTAIGQMASGIIHDIKNPMTTIKGFAGLIGDMEFTKEERKEYCTMITAEVDRLVSMVEDLLAFTRGSKSKLIIEKCNAEKYFLDIIPYIEKGMAGRNIEVVFRPEYKSDLSMDAEKFKRVILNIAGNAKEAMHQGGRFLILVRRHDSSVEIVFSDTGSGIPDEIIDTIFEPFVTKGKKSGTGLGLAIARKIVEEHGGSIKALNGNYSGIDGFNGANFVISIPA